ncbi:hypothetical protein JW752_04730 [Candidatus Peregrinibacteria bacterium]|nr:hypothetical protein [Candidatus Peregrinibacteria bacterium]
MAPQKRKTTIRCTQYPETMGVILLTIVVTAFVVGTGVYFWQNTSAKRVEKNLTTQINTLESRLVTTEKDSAVLPAKEAPEKSAEEAPEVVSVAPFTRCAHLSTFIYDSWYPDFRKIAMEKGVSLTAATSACFSEKGQILIFIIPRGQCQSSSIYRYNLEKETLFKAEVDDKGRGCLATIEEFGKREGAVIKLEAVEEKNGCRTEQYFDYDYTKNTLTLKREYGICDGKEGKWTDY